MSLQSLRDAQYRFNKIKSDQLELDYKRGLEVPRFAWVINEGDVIRRRQEVELSKLYKDAYLAWQGVYENQEFQRFGTAPVRNAYWSMYAPGPFVWKQHIDEPPNRKLLTHPMPKYVHDMFGKKTPQDNGATMVFRRFPNLMPAEHYLDILVKALLGFPQPMGYKQGSNNKILNDSWTVNLRSTKEESNNIMMDSFLRGFGGQSEELKKAWEGKQVVGVDVSDELKDLLKVYTDAEEHLKSKEASALDSATACMKRYIEAQDERKKVTQKLNALKQKLAAGKPCSDCGSEDDDEDEDE